jgi:predicted ribosomally synthesized peptide with nif11-like leader
VSAVRLRKESNIRPFAIVKLISFEEEEPMSIETVRQFWQKAKGDQATQAKLIALKGNQKESALGEVVRIAADAGFYFTTADYEAAVRESLREQHAAGDLSDKDLEKVAGGATIKGCVGSGQEGGIVG